MSFTLLLLLLSLMVIVPIAFVIKEKTHSQQASQYNEHQRFITEKAKDELFKVRPDLKIANTIMDYHNLPDLPISFRQILAKIYEQFTHLNRVDLSAEQRFTVEKLAGTRLPEVLENYLALDQDFAENTIIDLAQSLTSQDITYGQLNAMLEFMQRLSLEGQGQVANEILANRSYLQSVFGDFYQDSTDDKNRLSQPVKAPKDDNNQTKLTSDFLLYAKGEDYLKQCDDLLSKESSIERLSLSQHKNLLGEAILIELGQLVLVVERTLMYMDALLPRALTLHVFDKIFSYAIPNMLRSSLAIEIPESMQHSHQQNLEADIDLVLDDHDHISSMISCSQQAQIELKIAYVGNLLEGCLHDLEEVAEEQLRTGSVEIKNLRQLEDSIQNKQSEAQKLLESGYFII